MSKVLVIEDDFRIQDNLIDLLELEGYQAIAAGDGLQGVSLAKTEKPDLIISDVMMPGLDGYGVLRQLRQNQGTADIPFVFLTAKADPIDLHQGEEWGVVIYLTKPFTLTELKQVITAVLEKYATTSRAK